HFGKQPPCCDALIRAGIARVVAARLDPNPISTGGAARLAAAGIQFEIVPSEAALAVGEPFVKRIATGLPWVIAKWAQTIDGKIADRRGGSKWISGAASRRHVHTLRARVDCILTAIGTVRADDPLLTARGVVLRRTARRVVIDPFLNIDEESALVRSIAASPLTIAAVTPGSASREKRDRLTARGVDIVEWPSSDHGVPTRELLRWLHAERGVSTVMVEAGPGLLGRMFAQDLVDEARVFVAPTLLGDLEAPSAARIGGDIALGAAKRFRVRRVKRIGDDVMVWWGRAPE
ncbi:MAG: bifunctional diaminohydroxyphosphoribosylaminopyrimidine deaminase/5-amino-6-(5-phosphoribosylamino)uracil reductase RibD, partial [Phycisphaerae bacterium]|nr:bifunctional diaminohydroxyphosphoribosylaminopyrimidine deaminase/5-amino-6-(5-phosphoribosylamino)uracil reductase RibD [Phycisphaerae bacterium]